MENSAKIIAATWVLIHGVAFVEPKTHFSYEPHDPVRQIPSFLQPCHRRHKMFNLCVKTSLQNFFPAMINGSQELDFPPIEPLYVPEIVINEGAVDVFMNLNFHHVAISGFSNTKVIAVRSYLDEILKLEVTLKFPYLNFTGAYIGDGSIKTFPIVGHGPFFFNMSDVSAAWIIYLSQPEQVHSHFVIDNFITDMTPVDIVAKFGNAIDDDSKLGSAFNGFFNENAQEIYKVGKPKVMDALNSIFSELSNKLLSMYPANMLMPS